MEWNKLKTGNCPKCELVLQSKMKYPFMFCACGFKILKKKFYGIIADMERKQEVDEQKEHLRSIIGR